MKLSVVLDTDVISYRFKGDTRARLFNRHLVGRRWIISFQTWPSCAGGPGIDAGANRRQLADHLRAVQVYYADDDLCERWAEVMEAAQRLGRAIEPSDAWIAQPRYRRAASNQQSARLFRREGAECVDGWLVK